MLTDIQKNGKWFMHIGLKYQGMKSMIMIIRELIPNIGFSMRGDIGPVSCTIHQKLQLQTI